MNGLVIGKFWPLTKGHQYLIETAIKGCNELVIALSNSPIEDIPANIRKSWINELYPSIEVVVMPNSLPNHPNDVGGDLDVFYNQYWIPELKKACKGVPDFVFSSEKYGDEVADYFGYQYLYGLSIRKRCKHVLVDLDRKVVPISATKVRANPFQQWDYLDPVVRSYFVKTVCIYGPESTGKSTLADNLAKHYKTVWQPEWARSYLDEQNRHCCYEDMEIIAEGHLRERERFKRLANKVLFVDSDTITTRCYSEQYYGKYPKRIDEIISLPENRNDLYLFTQIDVPWVKDTTRDLGTPKLRKMMHERFKDLLDGYKIPYVEIAGDWDTRLKTAINAVDKYIFKENNASIETSFPKTS